MNPALTGRAFLYFAYPASWSGDMSWVAVDGYTAATILGTAAQDGYQSLTYSWNNAFLGFIPGSIGETSTLAILVGLAILLYTKVASWRIVLGVAIGTIFTSYLFNIVGSETNPMFSMPFWWHMVIGGYAFGLVFMATEPVSGSHTNAGRWVYGIVIGVMVILIRVLNPAFPEGMMLAILFGNLLGIESHEMKTIIPLSILVSSIIILKWKDFLLYSFDLVQAKASGLKVSVLHYILLSIISLPVIVTLSATGLILAVGLIITPGAIAFLLTRNFLNMLYISVLVCMFSMCFGTYLSFYIDSSPAPTIVLVLTALFSFSFLFRILLIPKSST